MTTHLLIGTCIDLNNPNHRLLKIGSISDWDRLTEECIRISTKEFLKAVGEQYLYLSASAIEIRKHPQHDFIWIETPNHDDNIGTIHHYFFRE